MGRRAAFDENGGGGRGRGRPDGIVQQEGLAAVSTTTSCRLRERGGQRPSAKEEEARNNKLTQQSTFGSTLYDNGCSFA